MVAECQNRLLLERFREMFVDLIREGTGEIICPYPAVTSFRIVRIHRQVVLTPAGGNASIPHSAAQAFLNVNHHTKLLDNRGVLNRFRRRVSESYSAEQRKSRTQSQGTDQL